eukprot:4482292-Pleurochrysis_carterae.AAC.1
MAQAADGDADQPPGLHSTQQTQLEPQHNLTGPPHLVPDQRATSLPKRALLLFSGPVHRRDGIAAFLSRFGHAADSIDNDPRSGGGDAHNLLNDA